MGFWVPHISPKFWSYSIGLFRKISILIFNFFYFKRKTSAVNLFRVGTIMMLYFMFVYNARVASGQSALRLPASAGRFTLYPTEAGAIAVAHALLQGYEARRLQHTRTMQLSYRITWVEVYAVTHHSELSFIQLIVKQNGASSSRALLR